jgi:hypothetical protein
MSKHVAGLAALSFVTACFVACGGVPLNPPPADGGGGTGGGAAGSSSAGHGGSSGGVGGHASPCPAEPVQDGAACTQAALTCEWGDDVRGDTCRTVAACDGTHWQVTAPKCAPLASVGACPADLGSACTEDTACTKPDGNACRCTSCRPTAPICFANASPTWFCPAPNTTAGCPPTPPNFGAACTVEGADCNYFSFECGVPDRVCTHGTFVPGQRSPCPVSSRRAKKDIRYLSDENVAAMAAETLRLRLATYEYKAPPLAGRRHLGFVIEDSPNVPAVDRDGDMVDLYGYTSMLLATTQAQQKQIESLRKRVEELTRTVDRLSSVRPRGVRR